MRPILLGLILALAILPLIATRGEPPDAIAAQGPTLVATIRVEGARSEGMVKGLGTAAAALIPPIPAGFERCRTESCAGDYVCDEGGAWEMVARQQIDPGQ